jgi:hypothetical protein
MLCEMVATMPVLNALWIICTHDYERKEAETADAYAVAAERISEACPTLCYIKLDMYTWRTWINVKVEVLMPIEVLDECEDEVEGPEFFHIPYPIPWNHKANHMDW